MRKIRRRRIRKIGERAREDTEMTKQKMKKRKCRRIQEEPKSRKGEPKTIGEEHREIVRERMKMTSENGERDG